MRSLTRIPDLSVTGVVDKKASVVPFTTESR